MLLILMVIRLCSYISFVSSKRQQPNVINGQSIYLYRSSFHVDVSIFDIKTSKIPCEDAISAQISIKCS